MKKPSPNAAIVLWVLALIAAIGLWNAIPSLEKEGARWFVTFVVMMLSAFVIWLPSPFGPYNKELYEEK